MTGPATPLENLYFSRSVGLKPGTELPSFSQHRRDSGAERAVAWPFVKHVGQWLYQLRRPRRQEIRPAFCKLTRTLISAYPLLWRALLLLAYFTLGTLVHLACPFAECCLPEGTSFGHRL